MPIMNKIMQPIILTYKCGNIDKSSLPKKIEMLVKKRDRMHKMNIEQIEMRVFFKP